MTDTDFVGPYNGGSYVLKDDFIKDNPKTTRTLVSGITKAIVSAGTHRRGDLAVLGKYLEAKGHGGTSSPSGTSQAATRRDPAGSSATRTSRCGSTGSGQRRAQAGRAQARDLYTNEFNVDEKAA